MIDDGVAELCDVCSLGGGGGGGARYLGRPSWVESGQANTLGICVPCGKARRSGAQWGDIRYLGQEKKSAVGLGVHSAEE